MDKLPPQNIEAEKSLLGCLMIDPQAILKIVDFLLTRDFYKTVHQKIYQAALDLFEKRDQIDILTVAARLKENSALDDIGGSAYLTSLVNAVPTATHILNYAKIVQQKRILRDLIESSQEIEQLATQETEDVDVLMDQAEKRIFNIAQKSMTHSPLAIALWKSFLVKLVAITSLSSFD